MLTRRSFISGLVSLPLLGWLHRSRPIPLQSEFGIVTISREPCLCRFSYNGIHVDVCHVNSLEKKGVYSDKSDYLYTEYTFDINGFIDKDKFTIEAKEKLLQPRRSLWMRSFLFLILNDRRDLLVDYCDLGNGPTPLVLSNKGVMHDGKTWINYVIRFHINESMAMVINEC